MDHKDFLSFVHFKFPAIGHELMLNLAQLTFFALCFIYEEQQRCFAMMQLSYSTTIPRAFTWILVVLVVFMLELLQVLVFYRVKTVMPITYLQLLFSVGTKLVHIISQLAHEVAEKHSAIEGDLVIMPSDHHFWFSRPRIMLYFIHLILFHVAFEIAYFFWILVSSSPCTSETIYK